MDVLTIPQKDLSNFRLTEFNKISFFFQIDDISILGSDTSLQILFGPVYEISNNLVCATSKASDQPAHTRSLIRAFASRLSIL